ncbi:MAG: superoxide dismutase [Spirochaetia bacterium]
MFKLIDLPYALDALQPYMSAETLEYHHGKHHAAYVNFVNDFITKDVSFTNKSLEDLIKISSADSKLTGLFNNAAQIFNHNEFWQMMKKSDAPKLPASVETQIKTDFGSFDAFKEIFIAEGKAQFGSGWVWVVMHNGHLEVRKYPNGGNPVPDGLPVVLGCDVWEHSYYIDYRNRRPDYLTAFMDHLVNWEYVEHKLSEAKK